LSACAVWPLCLRIHIGIRRCARRGALAAGVARAREKVVVGRVGVGLAQTRIARVFGGQQAVEVVVGVGPAFGWRQAGDGEDAPGRVTDS
jgi:hypothetical protein